MVAPFRTSYPQLAVGNGFTYQGYLTDGDQPANGSYDFYFELFDVSIEGIPIGTTTVEDIEVADGLFSVVLDFGAEAFNGDERWCRSAFVPPWKTVISLFWSTASKSGRHLMRYLRSRLVVWTGVA